MRSSFRLFRIAGIDIGIHYTWLFIFAIVTWSLAQNFFPQSYPGWNLATYWVIAIISALLLFVSVLLHELAHSLVAQARGLPVQGITLFLFGGVSSITEEPEKPNVELVMAIVGPLTSLILASIFWVLLQVVGNQETPVAAILFYLALINTLLAVFNLLPGFPLDGGRVLRSILWGTTGDLLKATNIAAMVGRLFGWGLIAFGLFQLITGSLVGGLWIAFVGWFLSNAANSSRQEMTVRQQLSGFRIKDVMYPDPDSIGPETKVAELVWDIFRQRHHRAVPVCRDDHPVGIVTITDVKEVPQDKWAEIPVENIMTREPLYSVSPEDDLNSAMKLIAQHDLNQVLVLDQGKCVGLLGRADIISHLQLSQELGIKPSRGTRQQGA